MAAAPLPPLATKGTDPAAEAGVQTLERHLEAVVPVEIAWVKAHPGADLPVFADPAAALAVLGTCLALSRARPGTSKQTQRLLEEVEELTTSRILALAAMSETPEARSLAVELVPH